MPYTDTDREAQNNYVKKLLEENPKLGINPIIIEDDNFLKSFGISIPHKSNLPLGQVKFIAEDFIVEEIAWNRSISTIDYPKESTPSGEFNGATLVKYKMTTHEAVSNIAGQLDLPVDKIKYRGLKDKPAITSQKISFPQIPSEKLKSISSQYFFLKDYTYDKHPFTRNLLGNKFTILIRTKQNENNDMYWPVIEGLKEVKANGCLNFFYVQRFGTPRLTGHLLGLLMLKGNYKAAIEEYLFGSTDREFEFLRMTRFKAKEHKEDMREVKKILSNLPNIFHYEIRAVEYLIDNPDDYLGALQSITEQTKMWASALWSYIFNMRLSSLSSKGNIPKYLPNIWSKDSADWEEYKEELTKLNVYPLPIENIEKLGFVPFTKATEETKFYPEIYDAKIIKEGMILSFSLQKGSYATTFLSYLFDLVTNTKMENLDDKLIDIKFIMENKDQTETLQYFDPVRAQKKPEGIEPSGLSSSI